jgi:hypothetical protein
LQVAVAVVADMVVAVAQVVIFQLLLQFFLGKRQA